MIFHHNGLRQSVFFSWPGRVLKCHPASLTIIVLSIGLRFSSAAWQTKSIPTMESSRDVPVTISSSDPVHGDLKYELIEDLCIGSEADPQKLFNLVVDIDCDNAGNIYVVDADNFRIQVFDQSGRYIRTVGRRGQGPGEFQGPRSICLDEAAGRIAIIERGGIIRIFGLDGKFEESILVSGLRKLFSSGKGRFLALLIKGDDKKAAYSNILCRVDSMGQISGIMEYPFYPFSAKLSTGSYAYSENRYEEGLRLAKLSKETFAIGHSGAFEIMLINAEGAILSRFQKDEPPPVFTAEERRKFKIAEARRRANAVPKKKPYFFELLADSLDRIYVQRNMAAGTTSIEVRDKELDVFDRTGRFLYRTRLPANTRVIRDGRLYCWEVNEDEGMEYVKRYRIQNWNRIVAAK